jgi:hypothetical protein
MNSQDAAMIEAAIAEVLRRFRANELEPLRKRLATVERDLLTVEVRMFGTEPAGNVTRLRSVR